MMTTDYHPHAKGVCPIPLWLDDKYFEWLMNIIEGKVDISDEVRKELVICGREKIKLTRAKYKEQITKSLNKTKKKKV